MSLHIQGDTPPTGFGHYACFMSARERPRTHGILTGYTPEALQSCLTLWNRRFECTISYILGR